MQKSFIDSNNLKYCTQSVQSVYLILCYTQQPVTSSAILNLTSFFVSSNCVILFLLATSICFHANSTAIIFQNPRATEITNAPCQWKPRPSKSSNVCFLNYVPTRWWYLRGLYASHRMLHFGHVNVTHKTSRLIDNRCCSNTWNRIEFEVFIKNVNRQSFCLSWRQFGWNVSDVKLNKKCYCAE